MTRGQVTKNKQNGQQKQDFFGKKHELTICVGIALFGVLPTLSHAQNFITSDKITHPIPNNMMGHAPTPAAITQETTKVEPNSTDNDLTTFATNTAQITSSSPDIIPPKPIHPSPSMDTTLINNESISQDHHANTQKSQSLAKLAQYYHAKPSTGGHVARCDGVWVLPKRQNLSQNLGYQGGDDNNTFYAQADYAYHDNKDHAELVGNVIIEQDGQQITANKLTYQPSTGQMHATGQVLFSDDRLSDADASKVSGAGIIGVAYDLHHLNDGKTVIAHDVAFASTAINAHGNRR